MTQGGPVTLESINNIVCQIETLFLSAARSSFGYKGKIKITNTTDGNKKKWFNSEWRSVRNSYHIARKKYNKYKTTFYKEQLKRISKTYKQVLSKSARAYKNDTIQKLKNLKNAKPREFWKIINSINNDKQTKCPLNDLYEHLKNINTENRNEAGGDNLNHTDDNLNNMNKEINQCITESEIHAAVQKLKK